jgi:uncharacterized protein involved in oxidation of intracellular sulfur
MKLGVVIYSHDSETVRNALRFGNHALAMGDEVRVFLLGKGVECESLGTEIFKVGEEWQTFIDSGGTISACDACLEVRQSPESVTCPTSTVAEMYRIVQESDKVVTF